VFQSYKAGSALVRFRWAARRWLREADLVLEVQENYRRSALSCRRLSDGSVTQYRQVHSSSGGSVSFLGSVASFEMTRPGEIWVSCTATA